MVAFGNEADRRKDGSECASAPAIIGYLFDKLNIPLAPLVLSVVLGELLEQSFRRALTISGGSLDIFWQSPNCLVLLALSVLSLASPLLVPRLARYFCSENE
jgi:putative tricarboxylic transport membrane protein